MSRKVVAIVTGYTKVDGLLELSFAPLRRLKAAGIIDRIIYVTWDDHGLDQLLTPLASMSDVDFLRIPQPTPTGAFHEKSFKYQRHNFLSALAMVPDDDALIIKARPDFVFTDAFLASKILHFDKTCALPHLERALGITMPPSPFTAKLWLPWADASQPFFFEDGVFAGVRADMAKLQPDETEELIMTSGDADSDWSVHMLRFIHPFLDDYPILRKYMSELRYFVKDTDYRQTTLPIMIGDPYFWCLIVISAWILANNFHVDCGNQGELLLYSNRYLATLSDTALGRMEACPPYNNVQGWRQGQQPGGVTPCILRNYARLMDDSWQTALFTTPILRDIPRNNLIGILNTVASYKTGILQGMETAFYKTMRTLYDQHWLKRAA